MPELLEADTALAQSSAYRSLSLMIDAGVVRQLVQVGDDARSNSPSTSPSIIIT